MVTGIAGVAPQQGVSNPVVVSTMTSPVGGQHDVQKRVASEHRRSNKPIMEKRRRARINNCLNELKTLILDAMKKDPARHSKLEKADILEMTVKHLETLQRQRAGAAAGAEPSLDRFRAGFRECAAEVGRFPGIEPVLKRRLLQHLDTCVAPAARRPRLLPTPPSEPEESPQAGGIFISAGAGSGVRLVPTRLANGDIALVLPSQSAAVAGLPASMPTLIPIPSRTSSTASASSSGSSGLIGGSSPGRCYSPVSSAAWSPSPPPGSSPEPAPLALVTRRGDYDEGDGSLDDKPWRPW